MTLDRDRSAFGQRVWADATLENLGPGSVFYEVSGGCPWPLSITVAPEASTPIDEGRNDWTGDLDLLKDILTPQPILADGHQTFLPEEWVDLGRMPCFMNRAYAELAEGGSVHQRVAWDTDAYMGMPPVPGAYAVTASNLFTRGTPPELVGPPSGDTISVTLSLTVEGEHIAWLSPEQAIDELLSDNRFVGLLALVPRNRWVGSEMTFERDRWVATLAIGTSAADPDPATTLIGVVDARTGAVVDVQLEVQSSETSGLEVAEQRLRELTGSACSGGAFVTFGILPDLLERAKALGPTANTWITETFWVGGRDAALASLGGEVMYARDAEAWVLLYGEHGPYAQQLQRIDIEGISLWAKGNQVSSLDPSNCQ
jgi:hypothetical protein